MERCQIVKLTLGEEDKWQELCGMSRDESESQFIMHIFVVGATNFLEVECVTSTLEDESVVSAESG